MCGGGKLSPLSLQGSLPQTSFLPILSVGRKAESSGIIWTRAVNHEAQQQGRPSTKALTAQRWCAYVSLQCFCTPGWRWARFCASSTVIVLQPRQTESWQSFTFTEALPWSFCLLLSELELDVQEKPQIRSLLFIKLYIKLLCHVGTICVSSSGVLKADSGRLKFILLHNDSLS